MKFWGQVRQLFFLVSTASHMDTSNNIPHELAVVVQGLNEHLALDLTLSVAFIHSLSPSSTYFSLSLCLSVFVCVYVCMCVCVVWLLLMRRVLMSCSLCCVKSWICCLPLWAKSWEDWHPNRRSHDSCSSSQQFSITNHHRRKGWADEWMTVVPAAYSSSLLSLSLSHTQDWLPWGSYVRWSYGAVSVVIVDLQTNARTKKTRLSL